MAVDVGSGKRDLEVMGEAVNGDAHGRCPRRRTVERGNGVMCSELYRLVQTARFGNETPFGCGAPKNANTSSRTNSPSQPSPSSRMTICSHLDISRFDKRASCAHRR